MSKWSSVTFGFDAMTEAEAILVICAMLDGDHEITHRYTINDGTYSIRVDCETADKVFEVGLDKRSSLDSVQQAEFAGWVTGKEPEVIIVDTDGIEGRFEFRIETAADRFGVGFSTMSDEALVRWRATEYLRNRKLRWSRRE